MDGARPPARFLRAVLLVALLAAAFALGVTKTEDSDAWTHLALGREMVQRWSFPPSEPFTFSSGRAPFEGPEWLFQVIFYLAHAAAGFAGVTLLKATLITLVVLVLWKDVGLDGAWPVASVRDALTRTAVLLPLLMIVKHRIVERPDLVLMLFLSLTIYALNAYLLQGRRYLYWLPAVWAVWANMHPSVIFGAVPFLAVLGGGLLLLGLERWRRIPVPGSPSRAQLATIARVFAAVLLASLLNPSGPGLFTTPFQLATTEWLRVHILELEAPRLGTTPGPFIVTAMLAATLLASRRRYPVIPTLLVAPFVYLGLSGLRFTSILAIVAAPVLVRNFRALVGGLRPGWPRRNGLALAATATALGLTAVGLAVGTRIEPFANARKIPGFGVNSLFLPENALRYLDRASVQGRVFNTPHWGGYIAWRDYPRRQTILDGRFEAPSELVLTIHFAGMQPDLLDRLQGEYGFDVVVTAYPWSSSLSAQDTGPSPARWALVYWDDVALVYLRRTASLAAIIGRDEYRHVKPAYGASYLRQALADPAGRPGLLAESRRNVAETGSSIGHMFLGFGLLQAGNPDGAIAAFGRVHGYSTTWEAEQGLAHADWQKGDLARAIERYRSLLYVMPDPALMLDLGLALTKIGRDREAIPHLERARATAPWLVGVYPVLIATYHRLGEADRARALQVAFDAARAQAQVGQHIAAGRRLEHQGKLRAAVTELRAALAIDPRNPEALSTLGHLYLRQDRLEEAHARQVAALEVQPGLAKAHYGLGLVLLRRGELAAGRRHLQEFIRLEPRSYHAWQARETLRTSAP
jgi:tetratricopeptide (TPR) repeat protein